MQIFVSTLITACCGSVLTLLMFAITVMIQNSERIGKQIINIWNSLWKFNVSMYKVVIQGMVNLLKIEQLKGIPLILMTTAISEFLALGVLFLIDLPITFWVLAIALFHGISIGLSWNRYEDSPGLDMGRRLE